MPLISEIGVSLVVQKVETPAKAEIEFLSPGNIREQIETFALLQKTN
jgi:hypothetical protein